MQRPSFRWLNRSGLTGLCLLALVAGCDYGRPIVTTPGITQNPLMERISGKRSSPSTVSAPGGLAAPATEEMKMLLDGAVRLIDSASLNPGGTEFNQAIENLNQYFRYADPKSYRMDPAVRTFLATRISEDGVLDLESARFTLRDCLHLQDCLLYHRLATRVAGQGDDLARVERVFQWVVNQIQLVPDGALAPPGLAQAQSRPYDVLLRGMATEEGGYWAERSWLFMALCRQLGIDVGLISYAPRGAKPGEAIGWVCAALIDEKAYLFDLRIGIPIPQADGTGVATFAEAASQPLVLAQLDMPGLSAYRTALADIANGDLMVTIDSSLGYMTSRMKLLQENLAGKNRMILYRDPLAQSEHFKQVLGSRCKGAELWRLPIEIEARLFQDPQFVTSTLYSLYYFDSRKKLPLLPARLKQLQGDTRAAIEQYVQFRMAENPVLLDKKTPVPPDIQHALDMYATYFMALAHLDQNDRKNAKDMFQMTLKLLPEPRPGGPFYEMFRWGAQANLARLCEAEGDDRRAIALYCALDPTSQYHGNLLRARAIVWRDPTATLPDPLPTPAPSTAPAIPGGPVPGAAPPAAPVLPPNAEAPATPAPAVVAPNASPAANAPSPPAAPSSEPVKKP